MILSRGIYCLVDDDVYSWLSHFKWSVGENERGLKYGRRKCVNPSLGRSQFVYLHKVVAGVCDEYMLKLRDGNPLNLQKANLRITNLRGEQVRWFGSNGKSRFIGVKWDRYYGLWRAEFSGLTIGFYVAEMEAALEYNRKAVEILGGSASLNDVSVEVFCE